MAQLWIVRLTNTHMSKLTKERQLLAALDRAEESADSAAIESAVSQLSLYYVTTEQFSIAVPFWRRGAELLAQSTSRRSTELAAYLHNMAATCLIPGGLLDEARTTLRRSKELYRLHLRSDTGPIRDVDELLRRIET